MKRLGYIFVSLLSICAIAMPPQDDNTTKQKAEVKAQPKLVVEDESIPDSLLHPRWKIQRTTPILTEDLDSSALDLRMPENIKQQAEYVDSLNMYVIGSKIGDSYLNAPVLMTPEEYRKWSEKRAMGKFFYDKNAENVKQKGEDKFSFTDMHFDLGPAEKVFGPGGVRIKTQGTAELKMGATLKNIDNPSLPVRNRKTKQIDFDEKINLNLTGSVGDKLNMNLNYNTDATFDFDTKNIKLRYEGKEDEIIKLVEAGNVTFPSNSSLIKGASSLFGIRTDMQFGKLKLQTVLSQKNSTSKSVSSRGGTQMTSFEIDAANYEENRHFFLAHYFRKRYDQAMTTLPNIMTGIKITRVEVWITNKTGTTSNTRNIIALTDIGESQYTKNTALWGGGGVDESPRNNANSEYSAMTTQYAGARDIDQTSTVLDAIPGFIGGNDYEKVQSARLLNSSEYTVNSALGYISLKTSLQTDQVLAVAFEYTLGGQTYQVGEFSTDNTDTQQALFVKSLRNVNNSPQMGNWRLMMKNVYYLASSVEKQKFRLDIKYLSDTTGVLLTYIPEERIKDKPIIRVLGADRLDNNNKPNPNGYFDFVEGYTVSNGRVFLPCTEPFGDYLANYLVSNGVPSNIAESYAYRELYDTTKTAAKLVAEKDKYLLTGQYKGTSANVISLGTYNVPQGSVVVTAGGMILTEGSDYSVDYSAGEVTILNQNIIDAGTSVNVSLESNTDYGMQRKTMMGFNWEYEFSKQFQLSGTFQRLSEQTLTSKVSMGSEPLNNLLWGVNLNWKTESQWLTNMLNKIPFLHVTQPSQISFTGEFAQLVAGQAKGTQDNASYVDDFENTKNGIDVSEPKSWVLSSVPTMFPEYNDKTTLASGFNRAQLAWYTIDPIFTYRSSSLTPSHIKSDLDQLSNHYVREIYVSELYPNRDQSTYNGATSTLSILNLAYYPTERGPYNFSTSLNADGSLPNPQTRWGGMMRKLDTNDFEAANIEYIEFWLLDPFIYTRQNGTASQYGGDLYINLGEVSEDILRDGKKFYESGMPVDGTSSFTTTQWGKIPVQATQTYAFATTAGSRELQDVGLNGLNDEEERTFASYMDFNNFVGTIQNDSLRTAWQADPANDNYKYYRGTDWDNKRAPIHERYKHINNPQGNSPDSNGNNESYDTSYKAGPDVEDINQDYTLNEYERYYQYRISIRPEDFNENNIGNNYLAEVREYTPHLRNGKNDETIHWYKFRIPLNSAMRERIGAISDLSSIRFMRMFLTGFERPIILRFGSLDLVRGEWRTYEQNLSKTSAASSGEMEVSAINIEEHTDKRPVNYVLPPGISRVTDPSQPQLVEANEQAMNMTVKNLSKDEAKAVYKNSSIDMRQYKRLQMFVHANALQNDATALQDNQLAVFIRLGSDYRSNYYEYEIPLKLTPEREGRYNDTHNDRVAVWPEENMLDIALEKFTQLKKARNMAKAHGAASYTQEYSEYDTDKPQNRISVIGNPSLGEITTMMIGVRNLSAQMKSGEVWVNELRLLETDNTGGWAASGNLNMQLSDLGSMNLVGKYVTEGFGGIEDGIAQRTKDNFKTYSFTTSLELGKFFPDKSKVSIPFYYSVTKENTRPKYNPLDSDMKLNDALDAAADKHERDSIESITVTKTTTTNLSLSNVRVGIKTKRHPMPYDPANFSFSYSHQHRHTSGETTVYEREDQWRGALNYNYSPVYKTFEPFKKSKSKTWGGFLKSLGLNYLPQNIAFNTEMIRSYYELQERDMEDLGGATLPLTFSEQFLWNREFQLRWDLTKNLHMNFQSATNAEIEEPYTPINKDLYAEQYHAWKDSVWQSIRNFGTPLDYRQSFTASYQLPLNKLKFFSWLNADAQYTATYNWMRGTRLDDGTSLGNTITNNRNVTVNTNWNMENLYNLIPFLKKANERFKKAPVKKPAPKKTPSKNDNKTKPGADGKTPAPNADEKKLPLNKNTYQREVALTPDTTVVVTHNKKSKRLIVTAKTEEGKSYQVKYKVLDDNKIQIKGNGDSVKIKLSVVAKAPLENQWWYSPTQYLARALMSIRTISVVYRNQYSMSLPGFIPNIGDAFGQRTGSVLSPGLDFAFGFIGDSYLQKAYENGWLMNNDDMATPATTNATQDLQLKMTVEPVRDLKIDFNASRTENKARSIQYMYSGMPSTQSGTFNMTTISLKSALEGMGNADNGYRSASFEKFCASIDNFRNMVQASYADATYPQGMQDAHGVNLSGSKYNPELGEVNPYSSDVLIPAFLSAYTGSGRGKLDLFPTLARILPNWTVRYSGLGKLPWFSNHFKSVNINHSYKSIFSVGSYATFATFHEYMNGLGFVTNAMTGNPQPSSMFNISTVSINEAFSPLLGVDVTLQNNLTCKVEYRTTRVLTLSTTSIQINEALSKDWVVGMGYKISNFNLFGSGSASRKISKTQKGKAGTNNDNKNSNQTTTTSRTSRGVNHDLNLRLDLSLRKQAAITRDIATVTSSASSGNTAFKMSFMADYTLSRLLTLSAYYDRQTNTPLLSSSSYPTTTQDFGVSLKFSLTR
ncbi:MAG: cell surface protein SprA [Prevotella sp.]|nr:cell surface protein SprA [Prevotella sp.]